MADVSDHAPTRLVARPVTSDRAEHGEGPVWDVRAERLRWVDMLRGDLLSLDPDTVAAEGTTVVAERRHLTDVLAALRPRVAGGWVVATEHGFAVTASDVDWTLTPVATVVDDPDVRMNEGGCDLAGGFVCGSMAYDQHTDGARLFRLAPDRTVSVVLDRVTISNGFCLDPTGRLAYYADTPTGQVDVFDVGDDGATLSGRRPFVVIEDGAGWPDGLTVDAAGGVWIALYRGASVRRYAPDGSLDVIVEVATPHVTSCAFGGRDLDILFITTTQENLDPTADRLAGTLFAVRPGWTGLPPLPYRG